MEDNDLELEDKTIDYSELKPILAQLGKTDKEMRNKLVELGITGNRYSCCSCPIYNYLATKFSVSTNIGGWYVAVCDAAPADAIAKGVRDLMDEFDAGLIPELEIK